MFKCLGLKENVKNVVTLAKPHLKQSSAFALKNAYRLFLTEAQPNVPQSQNNEIQFLHKPNEIATLLKIFEEDSILDDFEEIFDTSSQGSINSIQRVQNSLELLKETEKSFQGLLNLVINTIFCAPSKLAGGGSTSAAIGCIWVNLRDHWQDQDILEFLIHETTHNLIFLDELCYIHYVNYTEIAKKENFSWSAILNRSRPLDKVFHSIVVSTEILTFRNDILGHPNKPCLHPPSEIMMEQTKRSIQFLKENSQIKRLLSERANYILGLCEHKLHNIEKSLLSAIAAH